MKTNEVISVVDDEPAFEHDLKAFVVGMKSGDALRRMDALEYHTYRQRNWYRGICLRGLADWNGDSIDDWDMRLKAECGGNELLKKQPVVYGKTPDGQLLVCYRLSIQGVGKRNMTQYIENILSKAIEKDWSIEPPNEELRSK